MKKFIFKNNQTKGVTAILAITWIGIAIIKVLDDPLLIGGVVFSMFVGYIASLVKIVTDND
jgi:hypothetical protein